MAEVKPIKVLLLEDETTLAEIIAESLATRGFVVHRAAAVEKAKKLFSEINPAILVVDVMLPDGNGFDFTRHIRRLNSTVPVIFLTSRSRPEDVVMGFESGGNDYLKKPFSMMELLVRMKALLAHDKITHTDNSLPALPYSTAIGTYFFEYPAGLLSQGVNCKTLSSREADLLHLLVQQKNNLVSRRHLLLQLWGNDDFFSGRSLDVFITRLRKYLKEDKSVAIINIRAKGYRLIC